jgi:hypothetical protein
MPVADDTLAPILGPEVPMLVEELGNLGLVGLGQQGTRPNAQDFRERLLGGSWLNQIGHVIVWRVISLLRWRNEIVKQPHDRPPSPIQAVTNFCA